MPPASGLATWYQNSYAAPFTRTLHLRISPFLPANLAPSTNNPTGIEDPSLRAAAQAYGISNLPMTTAELAAAANNMNNGGVGGKNGNGKVKKGETLFGPDVGEEAEGEKGWLGAAADVVGNADEGKKVAGEGKEGKGETVPLEVVKKWVERAKQEEGLHKTTTLQALVNIKRPSITLYPLPSSTNASPNDPLPQHHHQLHAIRFTYDATTPLVRITITTHDNLSSSGTNSLVVVEENNVIYSAVHQGGFNKTWTLPTEQGLDLAKRLEEIERARRVDQEGDGDSLDGDDDLKKGVLTNANVVNGLNGDNNGVANGQRNNGGRRFGLFRRARQGDLESGAAGAPGDGIELQSGTNQANGNIPPTILVNGVSVPNPAAAAAAASAAAAKDKDKEDLGMKLLIRIEGCDENGDSTNIKNSQLTHILVSSTTPAAVAEAIGQNANGQEDNITVADANKRMYVIKVVRREAIIGSHTFLLREIFGLSTSSSATEDEPQTPHSSYPPAATPMTEDPYASTPNECIVCLTAPRDVVLLPCRHLVVCRECAIGMIEFGAGGKVARREEGESAGNATEGNGNAEPAPQPAPPPVNTTTTTTTGRRKKKAKGWFCPVCRQPYTSLLRLALPETETPNEAADVATNGEEDAVSLAPSRRTIPDGASLRRMASRATLPERGEKLLESLVPDDKAGEDEEDDGENHEHHHHVIDMQQEERPQFVLGEEVAAEQAPIQRTPSRPVSLAPSRRSLDKQVV